MNYAEAPRVGYVVFPFVERSVESVSPPEKVSFPGLSIESSRKVIYMHDR